MLNPNKKIKPLDDRTKTRNEISNMIEDMMNTDENGNPEPESQNVHTA